MGLTRPWPWVVRWRENGSRLAVHEAGMRSKRLALDLAAWLEARAVQSLCGLYRLSKRTTPPKAGPGRPKRNGGPGAGR